MARPQGSKDLRPRKRRSLRPIRSPESGPDLPRVQQSGCDCSSAIMDCRESLASLAKCCSECTGSGCTPKPALGTG